MQHDSPKDRSTQQATLKGIGLSEIEMHVLGLKIAGKTYRMISELLRIGEEKVQQAYKSGIDKLPASLRVNYERSLEEALSKPEGKRYRMVHSSQVEAIV